MRFKGQPQPRFWEMEESQTDFGKIDTSATGLLHLLLAEFGLIYSNDWFMLPHPDGREHASARSAAFSSTTRSAGTRSFAPPGAGPRPRGSGSPCSISPSTARGPRPPAICSISSPAAGKVLESAPLERVNFMRDEMANMAWGVESIVPSQTGQGMSGYEASRNARGEPAAALIKTRRPHRATWPARPCRKLDSVHSRARRGQRQRDSPAAGPHGRRRAAARAAAARAEVAVFHRRGGSPARGRLRRAVVATRPLDARPDAIWVGRRKTAGRGEGWSNLVFDQIEDLKPKGDT